MRCPECATRMLPHTHGAISCHVCAGCGALWLAATPPGLRAQSVEENTPAEGPARECPQCRSLGLRRFPKPHPRWSCQACCGVFLRAQEMSHLMAPAPPPTRSRAAKVAGDTIGVALEAVLEILSAAIP